MDGPIDGRFQATGDEMTNISANLPEFLPGPLSEHSE
jgi:hypothetical protein